MQTPLEKYKNDLNSDDFNTDASQEAAVIALQKLFVDLCTKRPNENFFLKKLK